VQVAAEPVLVTSLPAAAQRQARDTSAPVHVKSTDAAQVPAPAADVEPVGQAVQVEVTALAAATA
jgi:hypothetical protein